MLFKDRGVIRDTLTILTAKHQMAQLLLETQQLSIDINAS
jgi:hypothetical protein